MDYVYSDKWNEDLETYWEHIGVKNGKTKYAKITAAITARITTRFLFFVIDLHLGVSNLTQRGDIFTPYENKNLSAAFRP